MLSPLRLRIFRLVLDSSSMQRLISVFIMSRLDYCNAVLAGLPARTLAPSKRVLNAAVRYAVVALVADRIRFKLCLAIYAVDNGTRLGSAAANQNEIYRTWSASLVIGHLMLLDNVNGITSSLRISETSATFYF